MDLISKQKVFGGELRRYQHASECTNSQMTFAIYLPPQVVEETSDEKEPLPALYWLSGLTCNDENFSQKAGAFQYAAQIGLVLVMPDTSPRGCNLPGEDDSYDLGSGAGFYLDATEKPWSDHYQMYSYVNNELPQIAESLFSFSGERSIFGHSMGGHGALVIGLKNPERYNSISAFAPICNPMDCPWGEKAFTNYLGNDREQWKQWDASELIKHSTNQLPILIDQGSDDEFNQEQLKPHALILAASKHEHSLKFQMHSGYDHSYYFISTFIEDHLHFHASHLK